MRAPDGTPLVVVNAGATETDLGVESVVGGVLSVADVQARDRAEIQGSVFTPHNDVFVSSATEGAALNLPALSTFHVDLPPAGETVNLEPETEAFIAPGIYGELHVKSGAILTLTSPGTVYTTGLTLEPQSELRFDSTTGPVFLYVANSLIVRGTLADLTGRSDRLLVGYFGAAPAEIEAPLSGTLAAPNSLVNLASLSDPPHRGAVFARDIELRPDAIIEHHAFAYSWTAGANFSCDGPCTEPGGGDCSEATAVDMGSDGNNITVANDGCLMVRDAYPSWWGTRTMLLQTASPGTYPVGFFWSNACSGTAGSGMFRADWQNQLIGPTNAGCATLIDLEGAGDGDVTLRYWGG